MSKKWQLSDDSPIDDGLEKAAGNPSLADVDEAIYGGRVSLPESGRKVAKPIALAAISPDPAQPRREVPHSVRADAALYGMREWEAWLNHARLPNGEWLTVVKLRDLLLGEGEAVETHPEDEETLNNAAQKGNPLSVGFMALVALASSIYREGLINPITVYQIAVDRYQIETGERRYQAYKMLHGVFGDEKWAKIPAQVVDKPNVWQQAAENSNRKPLNAIGMARQLALLVMDLNRGVGKMEYDPFEQMVLPGECDRAFYAQVAEGNIHSIPKGMSERVLQATGLKSKAQIQHYRSLLNIPDEVWIQADEENWAEGKIRNLLKPPKEDRSTIVDLPNDEEVAGKPSPQVQPPAQIQAGAWERQPPAAPPVQAIPETPQGDRLPIRQEEMLLALFRRASYEKNPATRLALEEKGMIDVLDRKFWIMTPTEKGLAYLRDVVGLPVQDEDKAHSAKPEQETPPPPTLPGRSEPVGGLSGEPLAGGDMETVLVGIQRAAATVGRQEAAEALRQLLAANPAGIAQTVQQDGVDAYGEALRGYNAAVLAFLEEVNETVNELCQMAYEAAYAVGAE